MRRGLRIEAKLEDPGKATEAQLLEMLQILLVDRFKLKFHRESKKSIPRQAFDGGVHPEVTCPTTPSGRGSETVTEP